MDKRCGTCKWKIHATPFDGSEPYDWCSWNWDGLAWTRRPFWMESSTHRITDDQGQSCPTYDPKEAT